MKEIACRQEWGTTEGILWRPFYVSRLLIVQSIHPNLSMLLG
jgi:hypothetical protein